MKNKLFVMGILAFLLVFGMMVVGCDDDSTGGNDGNIDNSTNDNDGNIVERNKTAIKITGISGISILGTSGNPTEKVKVTLVVIDPSKVEDDYEGIIAIAEHINNIGSSEEYFELQVMSSFISYQYDLWTGNGEYFIGLLYEAFPNPDFYSHKKYFYTNGKTWSELGLSATSTDADRVTKVPRYSPSKEYQEIAFSKFMEAPEWW